MKNLLATWTLILFVFNLFAAPGDTDFIEKETGSGKFLVKEKAGVAPWEVDDFHDQQNKGKKPKKLKHVKWTIVEGDEEVMENYKKSALFEKVILNKTYEAITTPNDPLFAQQWAHSNIQSQLAWDIKTSADDVVIAVIDTGVNYDHPDLAANLWTGPNGEHGFTALNGVISIGGKDDHFHGSHCAGIIGAVGNNALGVAGINWKIKIMSLKFLSAAGSGTTEDAILIIDKMIDLKQAGVNIRVSNNSWGASGYDDALEEAFNAAGNVGILNVCAAGNDNTDIDQFSFVPAGIPIESIVTVLASDHLDKKAIFSNYGIENTDLTAPGVAIASTGLGTSYLNASGTSMASPHVAGAAAMLFALNPSLTAGQAKAILLHSDTLDKTEFVLSSTGGGRLNLRKLWSSPFLQNPPPPNNPPIITLTPNTNVVRISANEVANISLNATDIDGDTMIYNVTGDSFQYPWFIRWMLGGAKPGAVDAFTFSARTNSVSIVGRSQAIDHDWKLRLSVTDGRGSGASKRVTLWTDRNEALRADLQSAILGFRCWLDTTGHPWFRLDVNPNYPYLSSVKFNIKAYGGDVSGGGFGSPCCFEPNVDHRAAWNGFTLKGTYSIRAIVMDGVGNFANSPSSSLSVSNSTAIAPIIRAVYNTQRGPSPLKVTADLRGTSWGSASKLFYTVLFWEEGGITFDIFNPIRQFTLTEPGVYAIEFAAADLNSRIADRIVDIFTVLPPDGSTSTNTPPPDPIQLIPPSNLAARAMTQSIIQVTWSDTSTGEDAWKLEVQSKSRGPWSSWRSLANLVGNSTSYSFSAQRGMYRFRIRACKGTSCSQYSNIAELKF